MPVKEDERLDPSATAADDLMNREFNALVSPEHYNQDADSSTEDSNVEKAQKTHTNSDGDIANPNKNRDQAKDKEEAGNSLFNNGDGIEKGSQLKGTFKGKGRGGRFKKFGPSGGMAGLFIGALIAGSTFSIPAALVVMMEKIFTNANTMDLRGNHMMMRGRLGTLMNSINPLSDRDCSTSKIKCKVTEMSDREKKRWEKMGVKFESNRSKLNPLNNKIRKMTVTMPDGRTIDIKNAKEFNSLVKNDSGFRRMMWEVQHPKAAFFIGPDSKFRKVLGKYGLKMGDVFKSSKNKDKTAREEENKKKMDTHTKAESASTDADKIKLRDKIKEKLNGNKKVTAAKDSARNAGGKLGGKMGSAVGIAGAASVPVEFACMAYNVVRAVSATTKLYFYKDLFAFFYPFMQAAGQLEDQGNIDPETIEYIADRLTWYQPAETAKDADQKSKIGLTATDSQGFQAALYGDYGKLKEYTKHYAPWYIVSGVTLSKKLSEIQAAVGGKQNIRAACLTAKTIGYVSTAAGLAATGVACAVSLGITCALQVIGGVIGAAAGMAAVAYLTGEFVDVITSESADRIVKASLNSDLKGVDLGNALAAAIGLFMMEKGRGSGMKPASNTSQIKNYLSQTDKYYNDYIAMEQDAAKETPFDPYNQYSFAGRAVAALGTYRSGDTTTYSVFANIVATTAASFGSLFGNTAQAGYSQPNEIMRTPGALEGSLNRCEDFDMENVGLECDWTGRSFDVVENEPIQWANQMENGDASAWDKTVDYMANNNYIEADSGKPKHYEQYQEDGGGEDEKSYDNEYLMYKAYCTEDRIYPLGTSAKAIDDYDFSTINDKTAARNWWDGNACGGNDDTGKPDPKLKEKLNYFFFYYNMCETQMGIANGNQKCWEDTEVSDSTDSTSPAEKNTGDWVIPTSGQCLSPYGQRWGTLHAGVDISPPQGTPIVAPTSMKIISAGDKSDGYGNSVVARATDGTNYMFRFGHMVSQPPVKPGQEVSKGAAIGNVGATGQVTGPHLHFEIYDPSSADGAYASNGKPLDPVPILSKHGVQLSCTEA